MGQEGRGGRQTPKGRRPRRRGCGSPTGSRAVVALSQPSQGQDPGHGGAWGQEMRDFCCQGLGGTAFPKGQETDGLTRMVSQAFWGQGRARTREEALACAEMKLVGLQVGSPPPSSQEGLGAISDPAPRSAWIRRVRPRAVPKGPEWTDRASSDVPAPRGSWACGPRSTWARGWGSASTSSRGRGKGGPGRGSSQSEEGSQPLSHHKGTQCRPRSADR